MGSRSLYFKDAVLWQEYGLIADVLRIKGEFPNFTF